MAIYRSSYLYYTGTARLYTVPSIVESATITYSMSGGGGGGGGDDSPGLGGTGSVAGYINGSFNVAGGDLLKVIVGGGGGPGGGGSGFAGGSNGQSWQGFEGGRGGRSGPSGSSGSGGGGGGATVILLTRVGQGEIIEAVAAGGGGGGGGGHTGDVAGKSAVNFPVPGRINGSARNGQMGADHNGDGGGGGGGGGGLNAGLGGDPISGDVGGNAGNQGISSGNNYFQRTEINQVNAGYAGGVVFDSADLTKQTSVIGYRGSPQIVTQAPNHYRSTNSSYNAFLNAHGVWSKEEVRVGRGGVDLRDVNPYNFTWVVNFPVSSNYLFQAAWDNAGRISVDGVTMVERFTGDDSGTFQNTTEAIRFVTAGNRNVNMYADNYGGPGSIGCVITGLPIPAAVQTGTFGMPGGARNTGGSSGFAFLDMKATLKKGVRVKVGGAWTTAKEIHVKLSGVWKKTTQVWVKINGVWKPAFIRGDDSLSFDFSSTSTGFGGPGLERGDASGGGGGGGGCKIICTKLHELGYLSDNIYEADEKFGEWLRTNDPYAYYGYVKWASVVVDWMDKDGPQCMFWIRDKQKRNDAQRAMAISWARRIATPWAQHMAFLMGVEKEDNKAGRLIMKTGMWISRMIGKYTKTTEPTKSPVLGYVMWATFGVFWLLAGVK